MTAIIGRDEAVFRWSSLKKPRVCFAIAMIITFLLAFYWLLHSLHKTEIPPYLYPFFSVIAIAAGGTVFPLILYVSYEAAFEGLNPVYPPHYYAICKRCYAALGDNDLKVASKDL